MKPLHRHGQGSSRRLRSRGRALGPLCAGLIVVVLASGCAKQGVSSKAHEVHNLFYVILWLALPVFIFVEGFLLLSVIRFRRRRGDDSEPPQTSGNNVALAVFFAVPLLIITLLLAFGEKTLAQVERPVSGSGESLRVSGSQWQWSADYLKEGVTVAGVTNQRPMVIELPVDKPVHVELVAADVIHEFYVPDLLFMRNAVPGHPNSFSFTPDKLGTYDGRCAQYCGLYHTRMTFVMKVVTPSQFKLWVQQQKKASSPTGSCAITGSEVELEAQHIAWDKSCIGVAAGKPWKLDLENKDSGIAHNFAIYDTSSRKHRYYLSPNVTGPAKKTFTVPALQAGKYYFQCNIHGPAMSGTLIVGPPSES